MRVDGGGRIVTQSAPSAFASKDEALAWAERQTD
jgi:hypothetical protein